jgi:hypothetical protein
MHSEIAALSLALEQADQERASCAPTPKLLPLPPVDGRQPAGSGAMASFCVTPSTARSPDAIEPAPDGGSRAPRSPQAGH